MATSTQMIARARRWLTSSDTSVLPDEEILELMNEVARETVDVHDIWFSEKWGHVSFNPSSYNPPSLPTEHAVAFPNAVTGAGRLARPVAVYKYNASTDAKEGEYKYMHFEEFKESYIDDTTTATEPMNYTIFGEYIWIAPIPTSAINVAVFGYFYEPDLDDSSTLTNNFSLYVPKLLVFGALDKLPKYKFEEDVRANLFLQEKTEALKSLISYTQTRHTLAHRAVSRRKG